MLPDFVVIGAMKAGTTSLYAYMAEHPEVAMPGHKELDFFVEELNWPRGLAWYEEQFAHTEGKVSGDISPNYSKHPHFGGVPERMAGIVPEAKLIYVLRDPIARMRSHWVHAVDAGDVTDDIGRVLLEEPYFRECSSYGMQLERFLEHYPRERVLLLTAEDLRERRDEVLAKIFEFLGLDSAWRPSSEARDQHSSENKGVPRKGVPGFLGRRFTHRPFKPEERRLSPDDEWQLRELMRPDMERLATHMPPGFDAWGVLDS